MKRKTTQAVKTLPTSIKEKRIPGTKAPCIPSTKRNKGNKSMGIRRSASGARKFISVLDTMAMKLQIKPGG
eukprot:1139112-Pelagomonas_calceolata.AAC.1